MGKDRLHTNPNFIKKNPPGIATDFPLLCALTFILQRDCETTGHAERTFFRKLRLFFNIRSSASLLIEVKRETLAIYILCLSYLQRKFDLLVGVSAGRSLNLTMKLS